MSEKPALFLHIKSFLSSPKQYLAARRNLAGMGTQVERWADLNNHDAGWDERTQMMAQMVADNSSVLEFGSGRERMADFLPQGCSYQPSDLAPRSARTLVCNLNEGFPVLVQQYDYIAFSGVIEYIHDLDALMRYVRANSRECIVSYVTTDDLDSITTRAENGWVHHYSDATMRAIFRRAGLRVIESRKWNQHTIYHLHVVKEASHKPLTHFFTNITRTVSASGIQFLITLCSTPIMTRLYEPAAYATFGIVNTAATVMIGIGLLSLPNAYCAEKVAQVRQEIIQTMLVLLAGLVLLAVLVTGVLSFIDVQHDGIQIPKLSLFLLPVLVLTYGLRQIVSVTAVQRARFKRIALCQVVEPLCSRGGSIGLGALVGGNPAFILASVALGHMSAMVILMERAPRKLQGHGRQLLAHVPRMLASLRSYGDFVFFGTLSQQAQMVVLLALQLSIAAYFSSDLSGQYILAVSILSLPISLIALATAPVVLQHFVATEASEPAALARHFLMATGLYLLIGACVLLPVTLFGETLFRIAFGEVWAHAGRIASMLSLAYIGTFALTGVQAIFTVTRRLKLQFAIEIGTCIPALLIAIACFRAMAFDRAIFCLSILWLLRNSVLLLAALTAALQHPKHPT